MFWRMDCLLEKDLRAWIRNVWSNGKAIAPLNWIEPARGSSIGFPDVLLPVFPILIPCELKIAKKTKQEKFVSIVRPVQCRFHLTMKKHGFFSCFLVGYGNKQKFEVWLSHNSFSFADHNHSPGELFVASNQSITKTISNIELICCLKTLIKKHNQNVSITNN